MRVPEPTESPRRRVVLTGAAGRIGRSIAPALAQRWELRLTDRRAEGAVEALHVADLAECRAAFAGVDAVVHLAANPSPDATWGDLLEPNVVGAYVVAQAAADAGVRRLVLASSLHAVSGRPEGVQHRPDDPPRPGNLYGATKAWSEALGAWLSATTAVSVVALRIGYFAAQRPPVDTSPQQRGAWLSARDAAELVRAAVESPHAGFVVANGISANRYRMADLEQTRTAIGYCPIADAWADD